MITSRHLAPLLLLLTGLAILAAVLLFVPWAVQAQSQEVTPTAGATGTNPPAKPTNLQASAEHDAVTLTWTASTDQTVTHYAILRRHPDTDSSQVFHVIESNAGPETSYTDSSVSASSTYIYRVKAVSPTGVSQWSGFVKAETPAAPDSTLEPTPTPTPTPTPSPEPESTPDPADLRPTGLTVSLVENKVTLSWTAPAEDADSVTGYEILRRRPMEGETTLATLVADTESTATTYTDATANSAGVRYVYRVKALRGSEASLWSNFDRIELAADYVPNPTPTPEPESTSDDQAPTGLTAALADGGGVSLSWDAPAEDADSVTGYEVLRAVGEGELATLASDTGSTATAYTDATATEAGETYAYQVKAIRGEDRSQASGQAQVQVPHDPDDQAPTNLAAALADGSGVALIWTAPAEDADSVTGYEVLRAVGEGDLATLASDTGSTATAYTDATATAAGETYAYQVKAIRGEDRSQASGEAQVQVPHDPVDLAPSNLTALIVTRGVVGEEASTTKVVLIWTVPAEDADSLTGYEVLRAVGQGELATLAADTGSTTNTYTDATATEAGETYAYKVKAIRGEDRSQASGQAQVQVPHDPVDLAPSNLTAEKADTGIDLSWSAPAEDAGSVTGYEVLRAVGEDELITLAADTASTDTTYSDTTATDSEETYAYQVKAIRGQARSQGSNKVVEAPEPPATPENLAPSNLTFVIQEDGVELTWDAPAADADSVTGYRVLRRLPNQGENEWLVWKWDTGSAETAYKDGYAQTLGEYYMYRVRALRGDEYSKMSNRVDVRRPEAAPETTAWAPSNLEALVYAEVTLGEEGVTTQVKLTWDAPADGTEWVRGYEVQRATCDGGFATLVSDTGSTGTAYTDADAEAGESYTYRVRARRPQGKSLTSNSWTVLLPGGAGEGACGIDASVDPNLFNPELYAPQIVVETDEDTVLVKNTGQTADGSAVSLNSNRRRLGQEFITGTSAAGYRLNSISVDFASIGDTSTAGSQLKVTLNDELKNLDNDGIGPGDVLCTLSDPATFTGLGVHTFDAPETCPTLEPGRPYFAVIHRSAFSGGTISLKVTTSADEDSGGAAGWSIRDRRHWFPDGLIYGSTDSESHLIEVSAAAVVFDEQDPVNKHFNTLHAAGNLLPRGLWSDGDTMWVVGAPKWWVVGAPDAKIYAYDMATKAHKPTEDFNDLATGNAAPRGIWSDGDTMWVSDQDATKVFAYDMTTKARVKAKEFAVPDRLPISQGGSSVTRDADFQGIWSDGNGIMWLVSESNSSVYAYSIATGNPVSKENFIIGRPYLRDANGIWGDAQSIWVTNHGTHSTTISAFWRFAKAAQPGRDIQLDPGNADPIGLWSDGTTMWVADHSNVKIYAYPLLAAESPLTFKDRLSVERVTDTTAIVALDLRGLPFAGERKPVSISINFGGATIYAHPDAGTARFMLRGLEPETQYTVSGKFGVQPSHHLGGRIFRTDYARLAGIKTSGLTHTEATVTVSLAHADVDKRCCIPYWVSRDETEPERTYYLRHKASDDNVWSDPVELTFSGSTTDTRLTGLDPGTAYDVEVGEDPTFMPPRASSGSYTGTLTVGDSGLGITGYDAVGCNGFCTPFGSLSPEPTFEVNGVERSITQLRIFPFGGPGFNEPYLWVVFDGSIELATEFTLTLGGTEYSSADATRQGEDLFEWPMSPGWSADDEVAVQIDFTAAAVDFREGTTLEEFGAFTTPTMPPTLHFEAEMTVDVGAAFTGFDIAVNSISPGNTFTVDGVQFTVSTVGYQKTGGLIGFHLEVQPAIPFDFTLTLGATQLKSSSASSQSGFNGGTLYRWAGTTDPNWASGATVDLVLDVPLIDICGRSQAVADAIVAATPSPDFCHMVSPFDLAAITELDLTGKSGYGLKAGDFAGLSGLEILNLSGYSLGGHTWNQLPVGLFDGLDSLEVLDLSDTNLLNLNRGIFGGLSNLIELDLSDTLLQGNAVPVGVFDGLDSLQILRIANAGYEGRGINFVDEDIFRGLNTLRELDVGPIRPHEDVLAPLTSLETLNGEDYTP